MAGPRNAPSSDDLHSRRGAVRRAIAKLWVALRGGATWSLLSRASLAAAEPSTISTGTPESSELEQAIALGLDWLASRQLSDGAFGVRGAYARNVGVSALCGTAFLCSGGERGTYARQTRSCTDYLLSRSQPSGFLVEADVRTHGPMYGHGFATMYLGQVYGMDDRPTVWDVLKRGVALIVSAQDPSGAWRYTPSPDDADVSVTTCQMIALQSAHAAGIAIPRDVQDRSVEFLRRCQNPDGGLRYRLTDPPVSLFPRSAAAVVALMGAGLAESAMVRRAREYLALPATTPPPDQAEYYYYGRFYAAQAAWLAGAAVWDRWFPAVRDELVARQQPDGRWLDHYIGDEYATAMALIVLQLPRNVVPLFSR